MNHPKLILVFVRHGDYQQKPNCPSANQPFELTDQGMAQSQTTADMIAQYAAKHHLQIHPAIHSSNLLRAWQTAKIIKDHLKSPCHIETTVRLNERSVGSVANLEITEIEALLEIDPRYECPDFDWKSDSFYCLPFDGTESLMQSGERVANFIRKEFTEIKQTLTQDTLKIMVGHGASFRHAAHLLGILTFDEISQYSMHHAVPLFFEFSKAQNNQAWSFSRVFGEWKVRSPKNLSLSTESPVELD